MDTQIFLNEFNSKKSVSNTSGLNVSLGGKRRLLPLTDASYVISAYEQYEKERNDCNIIRLTCQVNPICTNVLFNRVTEIVKREGSSGVTVLNYGVSGDTTDEINFGNVQYKERTMNFWSGNTAAYQSVDAVANTLSYQTTVTRAVANSSPNYYSVEPFSEVDSLHPTNAIRDMQLTKPDENGDSFIYHCGLDILNNHLIRSKTFKPISRMPDDFNEEYTAFNTIADVMRDVNGNKVIEKMYFPVSAQIDGNTKILARHLYEYDDIQSFKDAIDKMRIEKYNGWFGFENNSKIKSYENFNTNDSLGLERPIMYMNGGDFVDMYPSRDLYSFIPKWNEYRNRVEKNWNYCITYPSSSVTEGFEEFIETNNGVNSLKAIYFDENTRADNGTTQIVIYSISKHGLAEGDYVNIYNTYKKGDETVTEKIIDSAQVKDVVDDYIFTVFGANTKISNSWLELTSDDMRSISITVNGIEYKLDPKKHDYYYRLDENNNIIKYYIVNQTDDSYGYVNLDDNAQHISYKKVVGGMECEYYVRVFSRLPNFKFASGTTTPYDLYGHGDEMITTYQRPEYDFESHVSRLAFAKNIYSDDIGEIVFTDDINISSLKDNLGRPLTSVYLTIVKNNRGYREWYGFGLNDTEWNPAQYVSADTVEFSHCFGKITCGFDFSEESLNGTNLNNIKTINNSGINVGFNCSKINSERPDNVNEEEINYDSDIHYYGDLSYYDSFNAIERHIQPILHRFNTAQRESRRSASNEYFRSYVYDEIYNDDYDRNDRYVIRSYTIDDANNKNEGYYYVPHYEIPIKTFSTLNSVMPTFLTIRSLVNTPDGARVTVLQNHYLGVGDKAMIYDRETNEYFYCNTTSSDNGKTFVCDIYDEKGNKTDKIPNIFSSNTEYKLRFRMFKIDNLEIPSYAHILRDGTCRFIWRNIVNNGMNTSDKSIEVYPFTNGAFYINRRIDLYLRRQDPLALYGLYSEDDVIGREIEIEKENNYVKDDEIVC